MNINYQKPINTQIDCGFCFRNKFTKNYCYLLYINILTHYYFPNNTNANKNIIVAGENNGVLSIWINKKTCYIGGLNTKPVVTNKESSAVLLNVIRYFAVNSIFKKAFFKLQILLKFCLFNLTSRQITSIKQAHSLLSDKYLIKKFAFNQN